MSTENQPTFVIEDMITRETALSFIVFLKKLRDTKVTRCNIYIKSSSGYLRPARRIIEFLTKAQENGLDITTYVEVAGSAALFILLHLKGRRLGAKHVVLIPHLPEGPEGMRIDNLRGYQYFVYKVFRDNGFTPQEVLSYSKTQKPLPLELIQRLNLVEIIAPS